FCETAWASWPLVSSRRSSSVRTRLGASCRRRRREVTTSSSAAAWLRRSSSSASYEARRRSVSSLLTPATSSVSPYAGPYTGRRVMQRSLPAFILPSRTTGPAREIARDFRVYRFVGLECGQPATVRGLLAPQRERTTPQ